MGNQNRIWIAIAGIVIIGTAVTAYTNQFVSRSIAVETIQTEAASETPVENELLEESTTAGETQLQPETQAGPGAEPAPAAMARMMEDTETEIAETEMSPVLSPLEENSGASSQEAKTAGLGGRESYE
ncbi:MAG: hypothetical protein ACLTKI_09365, partial [Lachnospiraceae bacterium]